jgi:hypothetical protein
MPIVIDEVVIAVEVVDAAAVATAPAAASTDERQSIVAECVRKVLDILCQPDETATPLIHEGRS